MKYLSRNDGMKGFQNLFSRPLLTIIFSTQMAILDTDCILTMETMYELFIYLCLKLFLYHGILERRPSEYISIFPNFRKKFANVSFFQNFFQLFFILFFTLGDGQ